MDGSQTPREVQSTPRGDNSRNAYLQQRIQGTPLEVEGTPRSPYRGGNVSTPFSSQHHQGATPSTVRPRGDMGRARQPIHSGHNAGIATPSTPTSIVDRNYNLGGSPDSAIRDARGGRERGERGGMGMGGMDQDPVLIWGTTINVDQCYNDFLDFLNFFTLNNDFEPHYEKQLEVLHRTNGLILNLNCAHIASHPPTRTLYRQLTRYPQELIPIMDTVINNLYAERYGDREYARIQVRTYGLAGNASKMRDLDPSHIDQMLCIRGMVVRVSPIIPELKQAFFRCSLGCGATADVLINMGRIDPPVVCPTCQAQGTMEIIHNRCIFTDKQQIRLQETPDEIPEGETPHTLTVLAFDDLVDTVRPGDRVEITGIMRAIPRRVNSHMRNVRSIYKTYIDAIHFRRADSGSGGDSESMGGMGGLGGMGMEADVATSYTAEQIEKFHSFAAQTPNVYETLVRSFAPSIWELDDVKKGVLCLLLGGATLASQEKKQQKDRVEGGKEDEDVSIPIKGASRVHQRGDINILLCGDPGTSKSQLLSYVHKLTPRGIYTSGKGSSAVGLTASVVRDPETKDMVLESGALVLSDNGICCIDEFDKMSDTTRAILHEAMEQQTVSITKAGIIATLNARTSILASANPVESRYNARLSVVENIKLPPTLLSRFDLIYLMLDRPNVNADRKLAKHLVSLYHPDADRVEQHTDGINLVDQQFLKDFIVYARSNISPEISDEAVNGLVEGYLDMRSMGGRGSKTISATPRQLEALIRISQALAKMRLSLSVTAGDVKEAFRLMQVATQAAATDPRTGTIDMDLINTGRGQLSRELALALIEALRTFFSEHRGTRMSVGQIRQALIQQSDGGMGGYAGGTLGLAEVEEAVRELEGEGIVQLIDRSQTVVIR